jgi:LPPG:FO 2-phospho-L-lactate transferase
MTDKNIVLLVGGVGGAKLAFGLNKLVSPENLTIIVNTADDFWLYGLRICPDVDTIMYTLSGMVDKQNGWGVSGDTAITLNALERIGEAPWFRLGDRDLATHMLRTQLWYEGYSLTAITKRLTSVLDIKCDILPMTNTPVETHVDTVERGELPFQMYFVKHRWQPTARNIRFDNIEQANVSDESRAAIENADAIIVGPSNPWLSIQPILSVPGMRELLAAQQVPRIAVTPLISGEAVKGPTAKIMRELGYTTTAQTIAEFYGRVINRFAYDKRDAPLQMENLRLLALDTLMQSEERRVELASQLLHWLED